MAAIDTAGYVALTYDDGPDPGSTTDLLAALRAAGVRATFFNIGDYSGASTADIVAAAATLGPGGVLLMHDGGYRATVAAVGPIVRVLAARGLRPGMISPRTGAVVPAPDDGC